MRTFIMMCMIACSGILTARSQPADTGHAVLKGDTAAVREFISHFEIVVTAPRETIPVNENPAATSIVPDEWIRSTPQQISVDEALKLVPGVRIDNQATGKRVHMSIRGQGILTERGIRGIKVLLDGLPLNDPSGFAPDLYDVDWSEVDRAEVLRGPAAALYGGGSTGGVLNIVTALGGPTPVGGDLETVAGSNNFWKGNAGARGTVNQVDYALSLARITGSGYRDHTRFNGDNLYGTARWNVTPDFHLTPVIRYTTYFNENAEGLNQDQVVENPRQPNPDALTYNEFQRTQRFTAGVSGGLRVGEVHDLSFDAYFRHTIYTEPVPSLISHQSFISPGGSLQYTLHTGTGSVRNHVTIGSDLEWQTIDEYSHPNEGGAKEGAGILSDETITQRGAGVFLLDRLEFSSEWSVSASLRYDDIRNELADHLASDTLDLSGNADFDHATGRIGLAWTPYTGLNLYANWGQGFLPPATEELANNPDHPGGFNKGLSPALSRGEELGIRGTAGEGFLYDCSLYYLTTDNDFRRYRVASRPLETFYGNLGSSRRFGFETYLSWKPVAALEAQAAYTYSHFAYTAPDSVNGHWLPNSPQHQLFVDLACHPLDRLTLAVSAEMQSRWYVDETNAPSVGGFTLFDARIVYRWEIPGVHGEFTLSGRNLFARTYIAFSEPDPDGNSYQPGPGRELFFGLRVAL